MLMTDSLLMGLKADPRIAAAAPYIASKALLLTPHVNRVVLVKGVVDSTIDLVSGVKKRIVLGGFRLATRRSPGSSWDWRSPTGWERWWDRN